MRLNDRVALVTGGARGIGLGISRRLAQEGALTVIGDVRTDLAEESALAITRDGGRCVARRLDVLDSANVEQVIAGIVQEFGGIDVLVNNAGVHMVKPIIEYTDDDWTQVVSVNARGPFFTMRAAARHMIAQRSGKIVNIVTILTGTPFSSIYEASKHALMA